MNKGIVEVYVNLSKLNKEKFWKNKDGDTMVTVDMFLDVDPPRVNLALPRTKEEREAKVDRVYVGGGKIVSIDGKTVRKEEESIL